MGEDDFKDFAETVSVKLMADNELDENDLVDMVNEANNRDRELDEEESKSVEFTANVIGEGLESGRKLGNYFLPNYPNGERALLFQRYINKCLTEYEEMAHTMAGEGLEDFAEAHNAKLMADNELDENDLVGRVNETNNRDRDLDEEESESVGFTAKVIGEGLESRRKLGNYFLPNNPNGERALLFL
ncbi:uncharacterized protein CDAR_611611 [Caerostris darwini]|uniref:Uncharacterized protein n=1 Tax=Caerostris darwini TaxID=1538125 RepID=A0AAV4U2V7_9ARAC|nr:uncharacterized protein CDAR_611611 [Caerostris darwini]